MRTVASKPYPPRGGRLDERGDDRQVDVHRRAEHEGAAVGGEHGRVTQQPQVDERRRRAQLQRHPPEQDHGRDARQGDHRGGRPSPGLALTDRQEQRDEPDGQDGGPAHVQRSRDGVAARGHERQDQPEGDEREGRPEPVGAGQAEVLGDQPADRVAHSHPGRGGDRQQGDRRGDTGRGEPVARRRHREGHQPEPGALQRPAGDERHERVGERRDDAPAGHDRQRGDEGRLPVRPVPQASQHRRADRPHEQRRGQRPLRVAERDVGLRGHQRDQRGAEGRDDRADDGDEQERGEQGRRPAGGTVGGHARTLPERHATPTPARSSSAWPTRASRRSWARRYCERPRAFW